jgi:hypothetical protein
MKHPTSNAESASVANAAHHSLLGRIYAMKTICTLFLLVQFICVRSALAQSHILTPYFATNQTGYYLLPVVWSGTQKITFQTGYYKYGGRGAMTVPEEDALRFDQYFTLAGSGSPFASKLLSDSTATNFLQKSKVFGYAATLPTDSDLSNAQDIYTLTKILKLNSWPYSLYPTNANFAQSPEFQFYTLGDHDSIRVMELVVHRMTAETNVLGILVKRGVLFPTKKP